jgi:signal transduction histidine kinase
MPRTFQGRLTIAFVAVIALTLILVTALVLNRLDDYFTDQQNADLAVRSKTVSGYLQALAEDRAGSRPVVDGGLLDPAVVAALNRSVQKAFIADRLGQADVTVEFGTSLAEEGSEQTTFVPAPNGTFTMHLTAGPAKGQTREPTARSGTEVGGTTFAPYAVRVTLANPYTYRAAAIANVTGLLGAITLFALGLAVVVSAALARRFTTPLRQLTEASRALAEGDLTRRVPAAQLRAGSSELGDLAVQFNAMADRLEESVEIIRRDRDRSRDFLADVSHELRTPLAALRTFNQLLMEAAGDDPEARAEFLESSAGQIERLDWLAQNLLELSKLDSGLVLLDLRPDDLRAAVESAVHQHDASAARRGVTLTVELPSAPIRIRHDPPRIGQVVANLVGNALKFTPRGGQVRVLVAATPGGARIDVTDTGVGIEPGELPHIFERFYRGSRANEARGSGSGLGLAIVRSIVDMHGGTVSVESGAGLGSRFTVRLPRDPRTIEGTPAAGRTDVASAAEGQERIAAAAANVTETSPSEASQMNPASAP